MWRQAPITAAIVISGGLEHHSKLSGIEEGLHRVAEVLLVPLPEPAAPSAGKA